MKRPFSTGTDFMEWNQRNCDICKISTSYRDTNKFICHIDEALFMAYFDDGTINEEIFNKIGKTEGFFNDCPFKNAYKLKSIKLNLTVFRHEQLKLF